MSTRWLSRTGLSWIAANAIPDLAEGRLHIAVMPLASANEIARSGIGMAHGTTPSGFAAILDEQRANRAAIAQDYGIKPVH